MAFAPITSELAGFPLIESWMVERDQMYMATDPALHPHAPVVLMHPSDVMRLKNNGRTPFWSKRTLGDRELERDRRRHRAATTRR